MEDSHSLKKYFNIVRNQKVIFVAVTLAAMAIGAIFTFVLYKPAYEASTSMIINWDENEYGITAGSDNVVLTQRLINTYGIIATSDAVLKKTIDNLNMNSDIEELREDVSVAIFPDAYIIEISVVNENPQWSARISNDLAASCIEEIERIMGMRNVNVIEAAKVPESSIKSDKSLLMAVACLFGMMLGLLAAFSREYFYFKGKIRTPEDAQRELGIDILGVVPVYKKPKRRVRGA